MPYTILSSVNPDYMNKLSDEELIGRITLLSDTNQGTIYSKEFELAYDGFSAQENEFFFDKQTRF